MNELTDQINKLLDYVMDNYEMIRDEDLKNVLSSIVDILSSGFKDGTNEEEIAFLQGMVSSGEINLLDFYRKCQTALVKFYSSCSIKLKDQKDALIARIGHIYNVKDAFDKRYREDTAHFKGKGIIYSVITGGYDAIAEPEYEGDLELVLLTDKAPADYKGKWKIREIENKMGLPANRFARYLKMHPWEFFGDYDWSVYVDGKQKIIGDFKEYIRLYGKKSGMICFPHYDTNTLLEQAKAISFYKKGDMAEMEKQISDYVSRGYAEKGYMVETACLVRDHHDEVLKKVMDDWWTEINSYNHNRDQMSFDYACWKNGYEYDLCDHLIYNNPWSVGVVTHS